MRQLLFCTLTATFLTACSVQRPMVALAEVDARSASAYTPPVLTESLFDYKDRTLSEADIRQILDGRLPPRDSIRLAVFNYGGTLVRQHGWYDEENLRAQQALMDTLIQTLAGSPRVKKVILLPGIVTGLRPNIHQLRESAVRVQADMLLVFSVQSELFQKYRLFGKEEAKAYATSEAVLLDVRTGLVPHTSTATQSAETIKARADYGSQDLQSRALQAATLQTLVQMGSGVQGFLNRQE